MNTDDAKFAEPLRGVSRALDAPPEPPREEIWARIDARRRGRRGTAWTGITAARAWPGIGLAAALALGIAIGRLVGPANPALDTVAAAAPDAVHEDVPFQLAATHHLVRTEALLTSFPLDAQEGRAPQIARWAYDLLLDTRVLMDSPAGADPRLGALLGDLELILAQLATLRPDDAASEVGLIQAGIQQNDVMARLRTQAARPADGM